MRKSNKVLVVMTALVLLGLLTLGPDPVYGWHPQAAFLASCWVPIMGGAVVLAVLDKAIRHWGRPR